MTARKTDPKKKPPAKKPPALTLRDPVSDKKAELSDDQGVRTVLSTVVQRIGPSDTWRSRLPKDSTERVAAQILRKADNVGAALEIIKKAPTLHAILKGTEIEDDVAKIPKPKKTEKLIGVTDEKGLELLKDDVGEVLTILWPTLRDSIEEACGEESKKATVAISFVPETEKADAHFRTVAETKVTSREVTRTSKVRRLNTGRYQLELFKSPLP